MTHVSLIPSLAGATIREGAGRQAELDRMSYEKYLQTSEWKAIRNGKLEEAGYTCEDCGLPVPWLECHHLRYPRRGSEANRDLKAVCGACHREIHGVE